MSFYAADVGEVIIKPEYRKDFGHLFRGEYFRVTQDPLKDFVNEVLAYSRFYQLTKMSEWEHYDLLSRWKGHFETRFNKEFGGFTYGISYYTGPREFFTELLPEITESCFERESVTYDKADGFGRERYPAYHDTIRAEVGRVIVKPEYREDFYNFFCAEYALLQTELFKSFVEKYLSFPFAIASRSHENEKEEWRGKYAPSYDEETGRFVYGFTYNTRNGNNGVRDFLDMLYEITEAVISEDYWDEDML